MDYLADYQRWKQENVMGMGNIASAGFFHGFEQEPSEVCRVQLLRLETQMSQVKARYEGREGQEAALREELEPLEKQAESLSPFLWQTTPEAVARYEATLPLTAFTDESGLYDAIGDAWRACVNRRSAPREALATMFRVLRQMALEDG